MSEFVPYNIPRGMLSDFSFLYYLLLHFFLEIENRGGETKFYNGILDKKEEKKMGHNLGTNALWRYSIAHDSLDFTFFSHSNSCIRSSYELISKVNKSSTP